jgi:superkiller protein 3
MAISIDPNHASAHNMLGKTLVSQNKLDEALASYHRAIALEPTNARFHYGLGFALKTQGRDDEAIAAYSKAIELDPKFETAYIGLGNALSRQGKLDESIDCLRKAIELDPNQSPAHCNLGRDLWKQGKVEEAIACCEKAIQLDPNNARAHGVLGSIQCDSQRDYEKAAATFRKAIELDPKHAPTHSNLGNALYGQNKLADAIAAYRKAIEFDPENTHARSGLALALGRLCVQLANPVDLKLRDPKRAVELGQEAVELDPRSDLAWQHLGWAHYRAGSWSASVEALGKSCQLQPGGTGDSFQWIVLALAHTRLATQEELPAEERARHEAKARRWYEQADKIITNRWQARPDDLQQQAVWDFHAEAKELMTAKDGKE